MTSPEPRPDAPAAVPPPLLVAAVLVVLEGLLVAGYGVSELGHLRSDRLLMGSTTGIFFLIYGAAHVLCAWGMWRLRTWSRGPVLLMELLWLGVAYSFWSGSTRPLAIGIAVLAALVLAGVLHPRSVDVLNREEHRAH